MFKLQVSATIERIGNTESVTFRNGTMHDKRELILADGDGYEQRVDNLCIEFWDKRTQLLEGFEPGDVVTVNCSVKSMSGRHPGQWMHKINGLAVEQIKPPRLSDGEEDEDDGGLW